MDAEILNLLLKFPLFPGEGGSGVQRCVLGSAPRYLLSPPWLWQR